MPASLEDFETLYGAISAAFERKDLSGVMRYIHRDWVGEAAGEKLMRGDLESHVEQQFREWKDITWPRTVSNVRSDGERVTVRTSGLYRARKIESDEPVEMELTNEDTWVQTDAGWQNIHSVAVQ